MAKRKEKTLNKRRRYVKKTRRPNTLAPKKRPVSVMDDAVARPYMPAIEAAGNVARRGWDKIHDSLAEDAANLPDYVDESSYDNINTDWIRLSRDVADITGYTGLGQKAFDSLNRDTLKTLAAPDPLYEQWEKKNEQRKQARRKLEQILNNTAKEATADAIRASQEYSDSSYNPKSYKEEILENLRRKTDEAAERARGSLVANTGKKQAERKEVERRRGEEPEAEYLTELWEDAGRYFKNGVFEDLHGDPFGADLRDVVEFRMKKKGLNHLPANTKEGADARRQVLQDIRNDVTKANYKKFWAERDAAQEKADRQATARRDRAMAALSEGIRQGAMAAGAPSEAQLEAQARWNAKREAQHGNYRPSQVNNDYQAYLGSRRYGQDVYSGARKAWGPNFRKGLTPGSVGHNYGRMVDFSIADQKAQMQMMQAKINETNAAAEWYTAHARKTDENDGKPLPGQLGAVGKGPTQDATTPTIDDPTKR